MPPKGYKHLEAARAKMSAARIGKKHSKETRGKIGEANKKRIGSLNPRWKGERVGTIALHRWVMNRKPRTGICQHCGCKPKPDRLGRTTDFANISGKYRRDVADYIELCRPCHRKYDKGEEDQ